MKYFIIIIIVFVILKLIVKKSEKGFSEKDFSINDFKDSYVYDSIDDGRQCLFCTMAFKLKAMPHSWWVDSPYHLEYQGGRSDGCWCQGRVENACELLPTKLTGKSTRGRQPKIELEQQVVETNRMLKSLWKESIEIKNDSKIYCYDDFIGTEDDIKSALLSLNKLRLLKVRVTDYVYCALPIDNLSDIYEKKYKDYEQSQMELCNFLKRIIAFAKENKFPPSFIKDSREFIKSWK